MNAWVSGGQKRFPAGIWQKDSENDEGDTVVVPLQVAVFAQRVTAQKGLAGVVIENREILAADVTADLPLSHQKFQPIPRGDPNFAALAGRAIACLLYTSRCV